MAENMNNNQQSQGRPRTEGFYVNEERKAKRKALGAEIRHVVNKYADRTSLNGISFLRSSKSSTVRLIWTFLLIVGIAAMLFHLYRLFATYFEYRKHSEIVITFNALHFPAITICNVNPVRLSKKHLASENLANLIDKMMPKRQVNLTNNVASAPVSDVVMQAAPSLSMDPFADDQEESFTEVRDSFDELFSFEELGIYPDDDDGPQGGAPQFGPTMFEPGIPHAPPIILEEESNIYLLEKLFKKVYSAENDTTRREMGHQIGDMLRHCYFTGNKCTQKTFNQTLSSSYGNCYTIESAEYYSHQSGPAEGMVLFLHIETDEYLPSISEGKGAHLVIHEHGSLPFPDDEGIALAAGMETVIGLKLVEIHRLGEPHGKCRSVEDFQREYGVKYTRTTCQRACQQLQVWDKCGCFSELRHDVNTILNNTKGLPPCRSRYERQCVEDIETQFGNGNSACDYCDSPCSEKKFEKTVSTRPWPSPAFADLMVERNICVERPGSVCDTMRSKTSAELLQEFIKLTIYFEDLNFERYMEQADYELSQFFSDIGGTIGLWVGLSVLGVFEVFHLVVELIACLCRRCARSSEL